MAPPEGRLEIKHYDRAYGLTLYLVTLNTHYSHKGPQISFNLHLNKINFVRFFFHLVTRGLKDSYYPENRLGIHDNCDMYIWFA